MLRSPPHYRRSIFHTQRCTHPFWLPFYHRLLSPADELSALSGNVIIPRARRSAAIASQRRTASEIGKFVGKPDYDDDDSDEDGELGGNFDAPAAGLADGESDEEAELEF